MIGAISDAFEKSVTQQFFLKFKSGNLIVNVKNNNKIKIKEIKLLMRFQIN